MNLKTRKPCNTKAFTIIELLTVMSIIVILIGLMVPALNKVRRFAQDVKQKALFKAVEDSVELFRSENKDDEYPDSKALDASGTPYCGAMKLCEALMGQDLQGYHPGSRFSASSIVAGPGQLYRLPNVPPAYEENLKSRMGPYLEPEKVSAHMLTDIYPQSLLSASRFVSGGTVRTDQMFVLCDVYKRAQNLGQGEESKLGMPILYYRADPTGKIHDTKDPGFTAMPTDTTNNGFIFNYMDNIDILSLPRPWENTTRTPYHRLSLPDNFYSFTKNPQYDFSQTTSGAGTVSPARPYKADAYILISAGWDGEYGTADDITNYKK